MPVASSECGMSSFMYELGWRMESTYSLNTESSSMDMNMFLIVLYSQRVGGNEQMCQWRYMWHFKHERLVLNSDPHVMRRVSSSPTEILDSTDSKLFIRIIFLSSEKNHVRYKLLPPVQKTKCEATFVIVRQMECVWSGVGSQGCITVLVNPPESSLICSRACSTKTTWYPSSLVSQLLCWIKFLPLKLCEQATDYGILDPGWSLDSLIRNKESDQ